MSNKKTYTEAEIIEAIRNKNQDVFSFVIDKYSAAISGIIKSIVQSPEDLEDILQIAFVKVWNNFGSYDEAKGRLYTWMINIARNTAIDYYKSSEQKHKNKIHNIDDVVNSVNTKYQFSDNHDGIYLNTYLNKLPEDYKELIILAYYNGLTQVEIAEQLQMPLGTVKTKVRTALLMLRKIVKDYE